jgi:uncharacterized protein YbjQ (UPF0145 family)
MNNYFRVLTFSSLFVLAATAEARDTRHMVAIDEALNISYAEGKIDKSIKLYFGDQKHPGVAKAMGEYTSNKKTNAFNKSDEEACRIAFLSAVIALQDRARKEGGDAVVKIRSVYKGENVSNEKQFLCGAGAVMAGVALKGTVVKLAGAK